METGKQRIERILLFKGINAKQLSELCGYKRPQIIYDIVSGKTAGISQQLAMQIKSAFPEINKAWLLTGEGDMLDETSGNERPLPPADPNVEVVLALKDHIATLKAENERLRREIDELRREKNRHAGGDGLVAAEQTMNDQNR